ncbi:hypothetical protein P152DRAFT_129870 [Eremomyces bilateralis CBS 781.70]|uniref:Uncharacterized protein n=1 Tax=Eremomyces bilateralis CBS 781.70 TaxID=1392243 RepID=A0A6G1GF36_9PEZI|nr:uncharacterized protein P152DRAFT_129870 [Eremomyces bilateralis CBS 781.70]KAF1816612.1 hypothetical protein P152DRAFT_129870 [Eremomyces bilateralis CBS 781.70]
MNREKPCMPRWQLVRNGMGKAFGDSCCSFHLIVLVLDRRSEQILSNTIMKSPKYIHQHIKDKQAPFGHFPLACSRRPSPISPCPQAVVPHVRITFPAAQPEPSDHSAWIWQLNIDEAQLDVDSHKITCLEISGIVGIAQARRPITMKRPR